MEKTVFIIGQALGVVAVILGFINYQVKTREKLLFVHMATTLCFVLHYLCLGAWTGMALNAVGFVRNVVFYFVGKKGKVGQFWAIGFAVLMGAIGISASLISHEGWYFIFMVVGLLINSYSMSFSKPNNIRISILITSPMVLVYNAFSGSIGGIVYETVGMVSAVIGIIRHKIGRKQ